MRTQSQGGECTVGIGSVTQALHAQSVLARAAIYSRVEKLDSSATKQGCAYGVTYACSQEAAVRRALRDSGIRTRGGGGG